MTQVIIFPLFDECKKYTLDPFWQDTFTSCAINKFPSGIRYDPKHNHIILKTVKPTKTTSDIIALSPNPIETFQIMMRLFRDRLNLRSSRDIHLQKEEMETTKKNRTEVETGNDWKKIKPRTIRNQLLHIFVTDLKLKHKLTTLETQNLISVIHIGFQFHQLSSDDVVLENGKITKIKGLDFDKKKRVFHIDRAVSCSNANRSEKTTSTNRFYQSIDRFVKENQQRINQTAG